MPIDPGIIVAQIINFLLLIWLLQRFLYKPVRRVIAQREEAIRKRQEQAAAAEEQARQAHAAYTERLQELERAREDMLNAAEEDARRERARLLAEVAQEAKEARARFEEAFALEQRRMETALQERIIGQAVAASGRILSSLADVALNDAVIGTLERRLAEGTEGLGPIAASPAADAMAVLAVDVRTSFEPTSEQRLRLQTLAVRLVEKAQGGWSAAGPADGEGGQEGAVHPHVRFHVDPSLVLGVQLEFGGTSISWSAADFLYELEHDALTALRDAAGNGKPAAGEAATDA